MPAKKPNPSPPRVTCPRPLGSTRLQRFEQMRTRCPHPIPVVGSHSGCRSTLPGYINHTYGV